MIDLVHEDTIDEKEGHNGEQARTMKEEVMEKE